jgi:hypothetical protein
MKPLNIDKTGCSNISSNCVTWQGPDIECINLCKGDSVTEVVYKLALELCNLMDTFDLKNYDLKCFSTGVCQPKDFKDFLNILITKVCALQDCTGCGDNCNPCPTPTIPSTNGTNGDPNPVMKVAPAFYYTNQYGDQVTTMSMQDYVTTIGNRVSTQVSQIQNIQATLLQQNERITNLENKPDPSFSMPQIVQDGNLVNLDVVLQTLSSEFSQLENATGDPNSIYTNMQKVDANLSNTPSLATPGATMGSLPGWTVNPSNQAESFGNMWKTILDIRNAVQNLINNYVPNICSSISISLVATYDSNVNQVTLYFTGAIPTDFVNTIPGGTTFTIADVYNNTTTVLIDIQSVINNVAGYVVPLGGTRLNTAGNLIISASPSYNSRSTGSQCVSTLNFTIVNTGACPSATYTPTNNSIEYSFTTESGTRTYTVELSNSGGGLPPTIQTFTTTSVQNITSVFAGLTSLTNYTVRITVTVNGVSTACPITAVTTL